MLKLELILLITYVRYFKQQTNNVKGNYIYLST